VEDPTAHHLGAAGHAAVARDVQLEQELPPRGVDHLEPDRRAPRLALQDPERRPRRLARAGRTGGGLGGAQRPQVVPRAEPGRTRDLIQRVDVPGRPLPLARQVVVGLARQAVAQDDGDVQVDQIRRGGRPREGAVVVFVPGDGPIGERARRLSRPGAPEGERRQHRRSGESSRAPFVSSPRQPPTT
jgi:hypothetical protein